MRLQLLNYEVYQRRENLRFYGLSEVGESEDTKETLYKLLENRLKMNNARAIEFQRVHRLGKRGDKKSKPRAILARFLRYTDREAVISLRGTLDKESGIGIGPDLPKEVVEMSKHLIPKMLEARKQGKREAFGRIEPYKLIIDGVQFYQLFTVALFSHVVDNFFASLQVLTATFMYPFKDKKFLM